MSSLEKRLQDFLDSKNLKLIEMISKGYSSEIYLVENETNEKFALKIEKDKSPRKDMTQKEAENLESANYDSIGPKLIDFDLENRAILMEFIEGKTFHDFLFSDPKKDVLQQVIRNLLLQARTLDGIGLDHGQLAGKGKNILVRENNLPVIIDFEKASQKRKPHNLNQLTAFLIKNPNSGITKKIKEIIS